MKKKVLFIFIYSVVLLRSVHSYAQLIYQPYTYQFFQKLNKKLYSPATALHTSIKPFYFNDSSSVWPMFDSLMQVNGRGEGKSWLHRILINQHLIDIKHVEYTFYFDYITDLQIGREFTDGKTVDLNTRGYQAGGTIGSKFFFYTSGFENQGHFANYMDRYIQNTHIIPGQAYDRTTINTLGKSHDWSYSTAMIGLALNNSMTIALGEDKTFIGDGYRSVLLSDYASNYPLLRLTVSLSPKIQYIAMWAYMEDPNAARFDLNPSGANYRRKWGAFHYLDYNINNRLSLGFFNAIIIAEADDQGNRHGFDINYLNPILFSSSLGPSGKIPDHTLFGFNGKLKILNSNAVYGQILFDKTENSGSNSRNAFQLGIRGFDLFKVKTLNYLFEYNTASPYTYANQYPIVNYSQIAEPLAHPYGANFRELLGIVNYSIGKFDLQGQLNYAKYGLNASNINYGKDISLSDNTLLPSVQGQTGQGLATSLKYAEGTLSYMLNPKFNFRLEVGALLRQETNSISDNKTTMITFGLRSSFRNLYHDF